MASCPSIPEGWFIESGVSHGAGLHTIFFSNRPFVCPAPHAPGGGQHEAVSLYASSRTSQRSLDGWGTYSPPARRAGSGAEGTAGASPARPSSLRQGQRYHAQTLPLPRRALAVFKPCVYSIPQNYKTSTVDKPSLLKASIAPSPSASNQRRLSQNQPPKDQDQNQQRENDQAQPTLNQLTPKPVHTKRPAALQPKDKASTDETTKTDNNSPSNDMKRQVDVVPQNVFGQPRVHASLRGAPFPRETHKSGLEEELRKLIVMDTPDHTTDRERDASPGSLSPGNSLGSGPLGSSLACSPVSDCPGLDHLSPSDPSLTRAWDPEVIPLPDPDGDLAWNNLVDAAKAYDGQRSASPPPPRKPSKHESGVRSSLYPPKSYNNQHTQRSEICSDLSNRLHHLEALLRHLESNLERERQDKVALLEEVTVLRDTNQRLWEESLTANEQLRKLSLLFNVAPGAFPRGERL